MVERDQRPGTGTHERSAQPDGRAQRRRRTAALATLLVAVLLACPWSSQADPTYPGLPEPAFQPGGFQSVSQVGLSETAKARQWVAVPALTVTAWSGTANAVVNPAPGVAVRQTALGDAFFVSPPGAPAPYGYLPSLKVRTVGFGLLPVEASVQVSQRRVNGVPVPVRATLQDDQLTSGDRRFIEPKVDDAFEVRVTRVLVDGVDVGLNGKCRTSRPAPVHLTAPSYTVPLWAAPDLESYFATLDPTTFYHPLYGGQLTGEMELPPFTGCTTKNGDDLSAMMTLSVSGPGNKIIYRTKVCDGSYDDQGRSIPLPPGHYKPSLSGCPAPADMPYPPRPGS